MVEIKFKDQFEVSELAGQTVSEAREQFKAEFGIPNKAQAKLNGSKVKAGAELDTVLAGDDKLTFAVSHGKGAYLVGALLLALAVTGGIFASGFVNATTTLAATTHTNFADVAVATDPPSWTTFGFFKGAIPAGNLFTITPATGYIGDLVTTVTLGNADALVSTYRAFSLQLAMYDNTGAVMDINESGSADAATDWVMLTLDNGSINMFTAGGSGAMTVRVNKGFYITHVYVSGGTATPQLFCEVAQR